MYILQVMTDRQTHGQAEIQYRRFGGKERVPRNWNPSIYSEFPLSEPVTCTGTLLHCRCEREQLCYLINKDLNNKKGKNAGRKKQAVQESFESVVNYCEKPR